MGLSAAMCMTCGGDETVRVCEWIADLAPSQWTLSQLPTVARRR